MQQTNNKTVNVYLFPGQGGDENLFKYLKFNSNYKIHHITYPIPDKRENLETFAHRFINDIDTSTPFILVGVSLGGMICTELTDIINPQKTIIISSAKNYHELPGRYNFQKKIPINKIIPKDVIKTGARIIANMVESDRLNEKETCEKMLKKKDPTYLKRTIDMIVNWKRETYNAKIIHIHGTNDHTIPFKNVNADFIVEGGSHMMVLTQSDKINKILKKILNT